MEEICGKIMNFLRNRRYNFMFKKVQLGGRSTKDVRIIAIKNNQDNTVTDHQGAL